MAGRGIAAAIAVLLVACPAARAAFPGDNGKIAFTGVQGSVTDVLLVNPDGSGLQNLTSDAASDIDAAWSPDGKRIAWSTNRDGNFEIYVMEANGSGQTRLTNDPGADGSPAWSPDGTRIAFDSNRDGDREIFVMGADGSAPTNLTQNSVPDHGPAWSPDGDTIAFSRAQELWVMDPDGANPTELTQNTCSTNPFCGAVLPDWSADMTRIAYLRDAVSGGDVDQELRSRELSTGNYTVLTTGGDPGAFCCGYLRGHSWAPDGARIVWTRTNLLQVASPDGSGEVTISEIASGRPSWQPIIHKEFPRPKGATPLRVSLVVSFNACGDGDMNRVHGPPLASPSCGGSADYPRAASPNVTVGAPDWNGASANFAGSVRLDAQLGNRLTPEDEADVRIAIHATDVRCYRTNPIATCGSDNYDGPAMGLETGRDYNGELRGRVPVHLTDENNSPFPGDGTGPGTVQGIFSFYLPVLVPCAETPSDITIGSTCSVQTTADAVIPGLVPEQKRSLWGVGQISVSDGGADGDADTAIDNSVFLKQGIFIP